MLLKLETRALQFAQRCYRGSSKPRVAIDEVAAGQGAKAQCPQTGLVVNAKQEIPLGQRARLALFFSRTSVLAALHQYPAPAVWRRIHKDAEVGSIGRGVLVASSKNKVGIKCKGFWSFQPSSVVLE